MFSWIFYRIILRFDIIFLNLIFFGNLVSLLKYIFKGLEDFLFFYILLIDILKKFLIFLCFDIIFRKVCVCWGRMCVEYVC